MTFYPIYPFIGLLIVALIVNAIPMDESLRKICNVVFGLVALVLVLKVVHLIWHP